MSARQFTRVIKLALSANQLASVDGESRASSRLSMLADGSGDFLHDLLKVTATRQYGIIIDPYQPGQSIYQSGFFSSLRRLESGYLLAVSLRSLQQPLTEESALPASTSFPQPLAIACGITRLSRPLIPRAPGTAMVAGSFGVGFHGHWLSLAA
ncbi:hypothetical protein ABT095_20910 [Kitasatospora sp. NPDC002227]|uniref:hypothetical protein n=1 Tax=Kitasatospora sp. NPDC002227 TaxID=3154773 RepID=UPI00333034F0